VGGDRHFTDSGQSALATMPQLAQVTVDTARSIYGTKAANTVFAAFHARGIL
jgi:hypothetical protein